MLVVVLAPLVVVGGIHTRFVRRSAPSTLSTPDQATTAAAETGADRAQATEDHHLVAVNLYNQISMTPDAREAELQHAQAIAGRVASLYLGNVRPLPGTGLLLHFPPSDDRDRPLQVLCATFVLAELLAEYEVGDVGTYRLGLHTIGLTVDDEFEAHAAQIADVALLSALAKHMTVAVSATFPIETLRHNQVQRHALEHPLLDELATIASAHLVTGLSPPQQALVTQQVARLSDHSLDHSSNHSLDQEDATASESTF
jgi:hypothetical protein